MKVTVNVECTPEEARVFMGLPDVQPLQQALMAEMEEQMRGHMNALAPDSMVRAGLQGAEAIQKLFWGQMQQMMAGMTGAAPAGLVSFSGSSDEKKAG